MNNFRGIYSTGELAGAVALYRAGQWFGGKRLDCAGFSGVAVATHHRGTGACKRLLQSTLHELHREGTPLASLYASTQNLYRTVGFEQSGNMMHYSIPTPAMTTGDRALPAHRFTESSPQLLVALNYANERRARNSNGLLDRTDGLWDRLFDPHTGVGTTTYLFGDVDRPEGYAILKKSTRASGFPQPLVATDCCASTPAAMKRLIALVYDHRSVCDRFEFSGRHNDPLVLFASEQNLSVPKYTRWMNRIVDIQSALQQRGYPADVCGELHLCIEDETIPENAGRWVLTLNSGTSFVRRGGDGALKMSVQTLAPVFTSYSSASEFMDAGLIKATDSSQVMLANQAFAGPSPWMVELF